MSEIQALEARKAEILKELDTLVTLLETEKRSASKEEDARQEQLLEDHKSVMKKLDKARKSDEIRRQVAAVLPQGVADNTTAAFTELRTEPYRRGGKESYYNDLGAATTRGDREARERLTLNDRYRNEQMKRENRAGETTVAGAGGEFAPPLWQIDQFIALARPKRTFADVVNNIPLPDDVSSISLPKVATGTASATQGTQNTGINVQDITTTSVSTGITTVAGGAVISQQLLDQSPVSMDDVITADLARDLAGKIDAAVIAAVVAAAGNTITYTNASPTSLLFGTFIQQGIDQILAGNFTNPDAIIMRPDRWGRLLAYGDNSGRPLVVPNAAYGRFNQLGVADGVQNQGLAGEYRGVPVYLDPLIPNNLGAGTNQDEAFVLDSKQINLYESTAKVEAFRETYANQLSLFVRIHEYYGIIANRLPKTISLITGTGMIPGAYGL
jgi:HK97 family phage major capsid protein